MKPYEQLTWQGKQRRLRRLAQAALRQYGLAVRRLDLASYSTNLIYRVTAQDNRRYALRISGPGWRSLEDAESEVMWLDALAAETAVPVPRIYRTPDNQAVVKPQAEGTPQGQHALLMSWQPGMLLANRLTESNLLKMGELFGQLHLHGAAWKPPAGFTTKRFEGIFSRGEADVLLAEANLSAYSAETLAIIRRIYEKVGAAYAALNPADLQVIHCDLWHGNIKLHRGVLYPFDFEDTIWGYRLHDIAMAMLDLYEELDTAQYERLLAAFREGYERFLGWPEGNMEMLQIGRILWRLNYIARFSPAWLKEDAAFYARLFERYLQTGKLIPPLRPGK